MLTSKITNFCYSLYNDNSISEKGKIPEVMKLAALPNEQQITNK